MFKHLKLVLKISSIVKNVKKLIEENELVKEKVIDCVEKIKEAIESIKDVVPEVGDLGKDLISIFKK